MPTENTYQITNKAGKALIQIIGEISFWKNSSEKFTSSIDQLISSGVEDVELYINSAGGSMFEANEIANQISRFKGHKTARLGAIAATYLMTYFDTVIAASNTQVMLHDPIQMLRVEHTEDFDSAQKLYENLRNIAIERYSKKMGISKERVSEMMRVTTWLSAKEAKEKKLVESVSSDEEKLPDSIKNEELKIKNERDMIPEVLIHNNGEREVDTHKGTLQTINEKPNSVAMKQIMKALELPEGTSEEQVAAAINNLKKTAVKAVTQLAAAKGLKSESISKLAESDLENTLEMVLETEMKPTEDTTTVNAVVQGIENALKGGENSKKKSFDDYAPAELEMMLETAPEKYESLINKTYKSI